MSHSERKFVTNLVTLPADHSALTIVMRNNILFVGGKGKSEVLGYYNLDVPDPKWNPISIPDELIKYGKAIDDLLLIDNYLVVVDNIVVPKWILKYDISNPVKPFLSTIQELDSHGTYEEITKSCHKDNHFFILSNTSSPAGTIEHISLLDSVFNEIGYFSNEIRHKNRNEYLNDSNEIFYSWNSIEVIDNFLLIPSDNKGLGILNLSKIDLNEAMIQKDLDNNQALLAEPFQTAMRVFGEDNPYERLKELTRGQQVTKKDLENFVDKLEKVPLDFKERMKVLTPETYVYGPVLR